MERKKERIKERKKELKKERKKERTMDLENREVIKICFIAKMFLKRLLGPSSIF